MTQARLFQRNHVKVRRSPSKEREIISKVPDLPPEFAKFDRPFGLDQRIFNIILFGFITHGSMIWSAFFSTRLERANLFYVSSFLIFYGYLSGIGTTVGAHRLWTHRSFKANLPLKIILMLFQTIAMQYPIFKWSRDHRVHHKYTDTNADPHNAARGFWFSHITWLFMKQHPEVKEKFQTIDLSDLVNDPVVRFQSKYFWQIFAVVFLLIPMTVMHWLAPDMPLIDIVAGNFTRYGASIHVASLVNSAAHIFGSKPYDKHMSATENSLVSLLAVGEGWHNYHHTFPWDHKAAEYGYKLNFSTLFLHFFARIGWATDLKTVSHQMLIDRINRTGDGSHPWSTGNPKSDSKLPPWGWGDQDVKKEDLLITESLFPSVNTKRFVF